MLNKRERLSDNQWDTLSLMIKDGPVSYPNERGLKLGDVPHTFILWYPKGSSPTGYKEIEIHRETPVSTFWVSNLYRLFELWGCELRINCS